MRGPSTWPSKGAPSKREEGKEGRKEQERDVRVPRYSPNNGHSGALISYS